MKKRLFSICLLLPLLCGCGTDFAAELPDSPEIQPETQVSSTAIQDTQTSIAAHTNGTHAMQTSPVTTVTTAEEPALPAEHTYSAEEMHLTHQRCGYLDEYYPISLIIEDEEQLAFAVERYPLSFSEDWQQSYPLDKYNYIAKYVREDGDDRYEAIGLEIVEQTLQINLKNHNPGYEMQPDVVDGLFFIGAVPKDLLQHGTYQGWVYPDRNDFTQMKGYQTGFKSCSSTDDSAVQIYGDAYYLLRTEDDLNALLRMAEPYPELEQFGTWLPRNDFSETALLLHFYTGSLNGGGIRGADFQIIIENDTLKMENAEFVPDPENARYTNVAFASIPQTVLTAAHYDGWVTPE